MVYRIIRYNWRSYRNLVLLITAESYKIQLLISIFSAPSGADFFFYSYILTGACLSRVEYAYTTGELGEPLNTLAYGYDDTLGWKDLLTSYGGQARS